MDTVKDSLGERLKRLKAELQATVVRFETTQFYILGGYTHAMSIRDWNKHISAGRKEGTSGWTTPKSIIQLIDQGLLDQDEEVVLVTFAESDLQKIAKLAQEKKEEDRRVTKVSGPLIKESLFRGDHQL